MDFFGEFAHAIENGMYFRNDVFAVDQYFFITGRTESRMQNSAVFRRVDLVATKHVIPLLFQPTFFCQFDKQFHCFTGKTVF